MPAGYSGTPLPKKLGIKEGHRVALINAPVDFSRTLTPLPEATRLTHGARAKDSAVILLFAPDSKTLRRDLSKAVSMMSPTTALWLCWPKQSSPLVRDIRESDIRSSGLAAGLVDIKICAVDEDWSGLKFVYRLADRPKRASPSQRAAKK